MKNLLIVAGIISFMLILNHESSAKDVVAKKAKDKGIHHAERLIQDGNYDEAEKFVKEYIDDNPKDPEGYGYLGIVYYSTMRYGDAKSTFEKAIKLKPKEFTRRFLEHSIKALTENKDAFSSIERLNRDIEAGGDGEKRDSWVEIHHTLALLLSRGRHYPILTKSHLELVLSKRPEDPNAHLMLADECYAGMLYRRAADSYKKALELKPGLPPGIRKTLGDVYVAIGKYEDAEDSYVEALKLYRANVTRASSDIVSKIEKLKNALPKRYDDITEMRKEGLIDEAIEICKKRISLNAADVVAITELGTLYEERDKYRDAINLYKRAIKIAPDYPVAHFYLGKAYFLRRKDNERALEEFRTFKELIAILPELDEDAKKFMISARSYIANAYDIMRLHKEAIEEYSYVLELDPEDQAVHYNLAAIYYHHLHDREKTYRELKKAVEINPGSQLGRRAKSAIDFLRRNPDARFRYDFRYLQEY